MPDLKTILALFLDRESALVDERFIMHRFKATRLAVAVGLALMSALFFYDAFAHGVIRWDLFVIILAMAVTKVCALLFYRRTN